MNLTWMASAAATVLLAAAPTAVAQTAAAAPAAPAAPADAAQPAGASAAAPAAKARPEAAPPAAADQELQSFAVATVKLHAEEGLTPEAMAKIIEGEGLTIERYNEISGHMSSDPAFATRVNALLLKAQAPAPAPGSATAAAKATPAVAPQLPTTGDGAAVLRVLEEACVPMVRKDEPVSAVATVAGLSKDRRAQTYSASLGGEDYRVSVRPRGVNRDVCTVTVTYPPGDKEIVKALNVWSAVHEPVLKMRRNDVAVGADGVKRRTLSWEGLEDGTAFALVLVQQTQPNGAPLEDGAERATLLYSERAT